MRLHGITLVGMLAMMTPAGRVAGQDAAQDAAPPTTNEPQQDTTAPAVNPDDPLNAATWHRQAIAKYRSISRTITEDQWMAVYDFEGDPSRGPSVEVRHTLKKLQPALSLSMRAARQTRCDYGVDYAADDQQYQHFSDARNLVRLIAYDMLVKMHDDDRKAVADQIGALYRVGDHMAQERVIIGSLVGSAVIGMADRKLHEALDRSLIGPGEATAILRDMQRLRHDDPMRYGEAMANAWAQEIEPMTRRFSDEDGLDRFREDVGPWFAADSSERARVDAMTRSDLDAMLGELRETSSLLAEAFNDPDAQRREAQIEAISRRLERGEDGAVAATLLGDPASTLQSMLLTERTLAAHRETLTGIAEGRIDPMTLANAAVWYIKATMQMEGIDPDKRRAIDAYAARHDAPPDHALGTILNRHDVQTVLATLTTAATLERCDWNYAAPWWPAAFRPYHHGVLWCGRLLVADAARLIHAQRYEQATQRLACAYRLSANLARDGSIAGSLAAHRVFATADALADAAIDSDMLNETQIQTLARQVDALGRGDPFHYQASMGKVRRRLDDGLVRLVQGLPGGLAEPTKAQGDRTAELLNAMPAARMLSLAVVWDYWWREQSPRLGDMALAAAGLDAIFDVQAIRDAADFAPALTEWSKRGEMELVGTAEFPVIAPIEQRARESLEDYRRAVIRYERLAPKAERLRTRTED